jgi:hypothetical protein
MPTSCKVARDPNKYNPLFNNRQTMRQKLTWAIRLALAELKYKVKPEEYTEFERALVETSTDLLQTAFMFACEIEEVVHKKQFLESERINGRQYDAQMVLISSQMKDALNMEFHRLVLNRSYDLQKLAKISENDLMSAKAKELEQKRLEQFVREHEVQHRELPVVEEPIITYGGEPPRYYEKIEEERQREREREKEREKRERENPVIPLSVIQMEKTKKIAKQTYETSVNSFQSMSKRIAQFKQKYDNMRSLSKLNDFPPNLYPS